MTGRRLGSPVIKAALFLVLSVTLGCSASDDSTTEAPDESPPQVGQGAEAFVADPWPTIVTGFIPDTQGPFSISMKGEPFRTQEQNPYAPILTRLYEWSDEQEHMLLIVTDETELDSKYQPAEQSKLTAWLELIRLTTDRDADLLELWPITNIVGGPATAVDGFEMRFDFDEGSGMLRSVFSDGVGYSMISMNQSSDDTERFFNSLAIAGSIIPDPDADAAAAASAKENAIQAGDGARKKSEAYAEADAGSESEVAGQRETEVRSLADHADPFVGPPYDERELLVAGGSWDSLNALPTGSPPPAIYPELGALFVACGDGDGPACDALFWKTDDFANAKAYRAYADTCGGRTATARCTDLLGGDALPRDPIDQAGDMSYRARNGLYRMNRIPPPTMAPPSSATKVLDDLWLQCGVGADGAACAELATEAALANNGLYKAFGATCGGRARIEVKNCGGRMGS